MSRKWIWGAELGMSSTVDSNAAYYDGTKSGTGGTSLRVTSGQRSGAACLECDSGSANAPSSVLWNFNSALTSTLNHYYQIWFLLPTALPSSDCKILMLGTNLVSVRLTTAGKIQLWNDVASAQIGSNSSETIGTATWHCLQVMLDVSTGAGADDDVELRLNGTTVASATGQTLTTAHPQTLYAGWVTAPGTNNLIIRLDDGVLNDNGGANNTTWPNINEKVIALFPISDNTVGSWTGGAGGTTNLYDAINNVPPIGTASETDLTQIENAVNGGGTNYIANMESYTTGGIISTDTITAVSAVWTHGEDASAGTKTGQVQIATNPTGAFKTFTFGASGALGTWPATWRADYGSFVDAPSVTLGTSPTLEFDRTDTGTSAASICGAAIYVSYLNSSATFAPPFGTHPLQAMIGR